MDIYKIFSSYYCFQYSSFILQTTRNEIFLGLLNYLLLLPSKNVGFRSIIVSCWGSILREGGNIVIEWTIASLFGISLILLIASLIKTTVASKREAERIDLAHISLLKEMKEMKEAIRNLELDNEILFQEAELQLSARDKLLKREILDLYKRGYAIESIAEKTNANERQVQELLRPFILSNGERRTVANEN